MRSGQQNKRGRGRNNNNRKPSNPLSRSYDSAGPDVKIRGTAQHIAEKYMSLARDAQSSGDRVMAENYLQHAEHYNRIIAIGQAQMQERQQRDEAQKEERTAAVENTSDEMEASGDEQSVEATSEEASASEAEDARPAKRSSNRRRTGPRQRRPRLAETDDTAGTTAGSNGAVSTQGDLAADPVSEVTAAPIETVEPLDVAPPAE